jgi:hypothetical protein
MNDHATVTVKQQDSGAWIVAEPTGTIIAGPFATNAAAWSWLDRHADAGHADDDHRANVRALIDRYGAVW